MLIHKLKVAGLLSFGPQGIDLPMEPLNVLIGPNGSGKSNFLEAIALLQALPRDVFAPLQPRGGLQGSLWNGPEPQKSITMEATLHYPYPQGNRLRHSFTLEEKNGRPEFANEQVLPVGTYGDSRGGLQSLAEDSRTAWSYYRPPLDKNIEQRLRMSSPNPTDPNSAGSQLVHILNDSIHFRSDWVPQVSLVAIANPTDYPALWHLHLSYQTIQLYRNWSFGPSAELRIPASAHDRSDFLNEKGTNLATVLSNFAGPNKRRIVNALQKLYDDIVDIICPVVGGTGHVALFLEEAGNRTIPATRLSDGTLHYLCLLAILLHPEPAPVVVIEEPELGLHPDLLPIVADLLVSASQRSQLIVTTHSDTLVDALTDTPESVIVCEKHDGQTEMRRLDKGDLAKWLKDYTLGNLWSSGQIGGNRW